MTTWQSIFRRRHTAAVAAILALAVSIYPFLPSLPLETQLSILAVAVAIFGLPHGALDLALVQGASGGSKLALLASAAVYLIVSGVVLAFWMTAPVIALLGFMALAILHFGLGDTEDLHGPQRAVEVIARGGFVGIAPLVFHPKTTRDLFALLVGPGATAHLDTAIASTILPATLLWLTCLAASIVWRLVLRSPDWLAGIAELFLTTIVFIVFHPLAAFLLYFCFVHSIRHITDLGAARFPDSARRACRWLLLESLPLTAATVALGTIAWLTLARAAAFDETMMRMIFWGLSALTLPHMILTAWWHRRGEPKPGDLFVRHV